MAETLISVCDRCGSRQPLPDQAGNFRNAGWFRNALGEICHGCPDGVIGSPEFVEQAPGDLPRSTRDFQQQATGESIEPLAPPQTEFAILGPSKSVKGATDILMRGQPDNHPTAGIFLDGWVYGFVPETPEDAFARRELRSMNIRRTPPAPASVQYPRTDGGLKVHDIRCPEQNGLYRRIGRGVIKISQENPRGKAVILLADKPFAPSETYISANSAYTPRKKANKRKRSTPPPSSFLEKLRIAIENVKNNAKTAEQTADLRLGEIA